MSIANITITLKAKKTVGTALVDVIINGNNTVTGTAANKSLAEASIQNQLDSAIGSAQGNVDDLQGVSSAFNS